LHWSILDHIWTIQAHRYGIDVEKLAMFKSEITQDRIGGDFDYFTELAGCLSLPVTFFKLEQHAQAPTKLSR
jgi:hypothetical protein